MFSNQNIACTWAGLVIKAGSSAIAKTVNSVKVNIDWSIVGTTAWDVVLTNYSYVDPTTGTIKTAALTILAWNQAMITVYADSTWAFSIGKWLEVANTSNYVLANIDNSLNFKRAIIWYILINNGTASTFTGWTTALDTWSLTVSYIDSFATSFFLAI